MKINRILTITVLTLGSGHALAVEADTRVEERRGAIIGTVIGAVAGGPIGAGFGAIVGGGIIGKLVGLDREHREVSQELADVEAEYKRAKTDMGTEIAQLRTALHGAEEEIHALASAPKVPLQFRTGASTLEEHYRDHLKEVAALLAKRPHVRVKLSGFADRRGSEDYNQRLSEARIAEVRKYLMRHGVSARQIVGEAFGESRPVSDAGAVEDYFFDRRVVMEFSNNEQDSIANR